jgi:RNA polymerase sigma factor (sigma-70 family)
MASSRDADLELLEGWRAGNREAGDALFARHFAAVRGYFVAKFPQEHEDLIQEAFSRLVEGRDRFRGDSTFKTYLFRIARYVGHEHLRKRYKDGQALSPATSSLADLTGRRQSSLLAEREDHRLLLDALRNLPLEQQELVELYYWQRLTAKEIGGVFEVSESTVRGRIRLALKHLTKLHQQLGQQEHSRELGEDDLEGWLEQLREELGRATLRPE